MTRRARILAALTRPMTSQALSAALGVAAKQLYVELAFLRRGGLVVTGGNRRCVVYSRGRA